MICENPHCKTLYCAGCPDPYAGWTPAKVGCHWTRGPIMISTVQNPDRPDANYYVVREPGDVLGYAEDFAGAVKIADEAEQTPAERALQAIRAILVDSNDQWITDLSGADVIEALTQALTQHGLGATKGDDTEELGSTPCPRCQGTGLPGSDRATFCILCNGSGKADDRDDAVEEAHADEDQDPDGDLPNMSPLGGGNR